MRLLNNFKCNKTGFVIVDKFHKQDESITCKCGSDTVRMPSCVPFSISGGGVYKSGFSGGGK